MKSFLVSFLIVTLFSSSSALAACYSMKEAEAEQGIRIHSELMVIALNCQHLGPKNQENLYLQYKKFSKRHENIFGGYEKTLISFYGKEGFKAPERELHEVRTAFANKISHDAAVMRPDGFCKFYMPRIQKAGKMDAADLHKWASTIFPSHPVSRPLCAKQ